jgi:hypothetical protein
MDAQITITGDAADDLACRAKDCAGEDELRDPHQDRQLPGPRYRLGSVRAPAAGAPARLAWPLIAP